jgi:NADH dehydrogenase
MSGRHRVVVVGCGFGGLNVARGLAGMQADVLVVDRVNHHLFQPLLYQVATALLPPGDIAPAIRGILADQDNATVVLGEVSDLDAAGRTVAVRTADGGERTIGYDSLVVAAGSDQSYFGHDEWAAVAPSMKTLDDAIALRSRILRAFEIAALTQDERTCREWMTFVVVGAGPTGVELAGQLAALAERALAHQFRRLDPARLKIVLVDAAGTVLAPFPEQLRRHAREELERLGIEIQLDAPAVGVDERGIDLGTPGGADQGDQGTRRIPARTVIWAAGVSPSPLAGRIAAATGASTDHKGRITVGSDCSVPGHPEIFAIGDMADCGDLPGVAQPAIQEGRHVAAVINHRLGEGDDPGPFRYLDLGTMATISATDAVASVMGLRLSGVVGKSAWAAVHLGALVGWGNRAAVLSSWLWTLTTGRRQQRVILRRSGSS